MQMLNSQARPFTLSYRICQLGIAILTNCVV
uniref:Uncharacterized protein n=1 Tax=Arundo donax TaxID=35708 RepID=A0A0A9DJU2_ARUDO